MGFINQLITRGHHFVYIYIYLFIYIYIHIVIYVILPSLSWLLWWIEIGHPENPKERWDGVKSKKTFSKPNQQLSVLGGWRQWQGTPKKTGLNGSTFFEPQSHVNHREKHQLFNVEGF